MTEKEFINKIKRRSTQKKYQGYRASVNDARIFFEDLFNKY